MSKQGKTPAIPRPAAALLVVSGDRLLMVKRPTHLTYPGAFVFPGGTVSPSDRDARYTALRETFEETGLLLTTCPVAPSKLHLLPQLQKAVHDNKLSFDAALDQLGVSLIPSSDLLPFSTWTTPPGPPKRFETHFFITRLPSYIADTVRGDGGIEVVGAHWLPVARLPGWVRDGTTAMHSAQIYLTSRLAGALEGGKGWEGVERTVGEIGEMEVLMRRSDEDGRRVETLPNGDRVVYDRGEGSAGRAWVELGKARL